MFAHITNDQIRSALESLQRHLTHRLLALFVLVAILFAGTVWYMRNEMAAANASTIEKNIIQNNVIFIQGTKIANLENKLATLATPTPTATFAEHSVSVTKVTTDPQCVNEEKVQYLRYVLDTNLPIPLQANVSFVSVCNGDVAIKWTQQLGEGVVNHYFVLDGVDVDYVYFTSPGHSSTDEYRTPVVGDVGVISYYFDMYTTGDDFGRDHVIDGLNVVQLREWSPTEAALVNLSNQMYDEAVRDDWFYFSYAADQSPDVLLMNGVPAQPGPYGNTLKVPHEGGTFAALYKSGYGSDTEFIRWSYTVMPGDIVAGTEYVSVWSMRDSDPWYFCGRLERMYPVWQPAQLDTLLDDVCSHLWEQGDRSIEASLAHEGFQRADTRYGDNHAESYVPFVYSGGPRKLGNSLPVSGWKRVESSTIVLTDTDMFDVSYDSVQKMPIFAYTSGGAETSAFNSDIPWYENWGDPIVFVPDTDLSTDQYFDWTRTKVYRVLYVGSQVIVEEAVWKIPAN